MELPEHAQRNREAWNSWSDEYEELHGPTLSAERAMAWGLWRIPERELEILGDISGKDILEFGCGAARWSIALAQAGARPVGLDVSPRQLEHAGRLMGQAGLSFPLVEASAESVPLPDASFDIVFCDWGAMTFSDPDFSVSEAARLLRPGGLFAFSCSSPWHIVCTDLVQDILGQTLLNDYFGMKQIDWGDSVDFVLPYGQWVRVFSANGLWVEDLLEIRPPIGATSTYRTAEETAWARRWPMEVIWRVRKAAS